MELNKIVLGKEMSMLVVFPEDIDYAVKKNDKDILLFNGSTIYSAQDGSVYATYIDKPSSSFIYYAYSLVSVFVSVAVFTFVLAQ